MRRTIGALVATLTLTLGLTLAVPGSAHATAAAPATKPRSAAAVGLWTGTVSFPDGAAEATMSLLANGRVCLIVPPPGPDGGVEGVGIWTSTSSTAFTFQVAERFFDGAGTTTAFLAALHRATLSGSSFTSTGTGTYFDPQGQPLATFPTSSRMNRVSTVPQSC